MYRTILFTVVVIGVLVSSVLSDSPKMISYQGLLTDSTGNPLDTTVSIVFTIYDALSAGNVKWTETHPGVIVSEGLFDVILGGVMPIQDTVFNQPDRFLGITVDGDPEISPRTKMLSVGYSHRVNTVDGSIGGIISGDVSIQSDLNLDGDLTSAGKVITNGFEMATGASDGYVLTSDVSGNAAWQPSLAAEIADSIKLFPFQNLFLHYQEFMGGGLKTLFSAPVGKDIYITGITISGSSGNRPFLINGSRVLWISGSTPIVNWSSAGGAPIKVESGSTLSMDNKTFGSFEITITGYEF